MFKRIYLTTLLGLAIGTLAVAQEVDTQNTAIATNLGLYGGQAADIALDPLSDTAYATNHAPNGLFVSTDLGETWTGLSSEVNYGTGLSVEVDPTDGTAYATVGDTLLRSTDQGANWEDISSNLTKSLGVGIADVLVSAHDRLLVSVADGQVAISADSGESFSLATVSEDNSIQYLAASPDTDTFYAVVSSLNTTTKDELWRSDDGGETWTDLNVVSNGMTSGTSLWQVAVNPTDGDNIATTSGVSTSTNYLTNDGGDHWSAIDNGSGLAFDQTGRLYVGFSYTDDSTASTPTWDTYGVDTPLSSIYADLIAIDPEDENVVFNNSSLGTAKSDDRGNTWEDSIEGVTAVQVYDITQTDDKVVVWLGANGGLAKTENFDEDEPTWEYPILPAGSTNNVHAVWVNPDDASLVVAGNSGLIAYSRDGGDTWTTADTPEFNGNVTEILRSRIDDNILYATIENSDLTGTDNGAALVSTDAGETWTDLALTDDLPVAAMSLASDDTIYVGVGGDVSNPGIYVYDGSNWSSLGGSVEGKVTTSVLVHPSDDSHVFVTTTEGLYESTDSGSSWTQITDGLEDANNLATLVAQTTTSPITLYLAGQDGSSLNGMVYKSSDGGDTWGEYYEGLRQESFYAMFFDGLIAGNDRGVFDIKSRAKLKLTEKNTKHLAVSLRDAATAKKLKHKAVRIYRKSNGEWNKIKTVHTNTKGKTTVTIKAPAGTKFKATWKPSAKDRREYSKATSKVLELDAWSGFKIVPVKIMFGRVHHGDQISQVQQGWVCVGTRHNHFSITMPVVDDINHLFHAH